MLHLWWVSNSRQLTNPSCSVQSHFPWLHVNNLCTVQTLNILPKPLNVMQNRGRSNIPIEFSERGSTEFPGIGNKTRSLSLEKWPVSCIYKTDGVREDPTMKTWPGVMLWCWRSNERSIKNGETTDRWKGFNSCKVWSLECMFVSHGLYHVNIFSCITVLGALFLCCRLHLELIHHLKYWYVIDR